MNLSEVAARFWRRVDRSAGEDACWLYQGYRTTDGHGQFRISARPNVTRTAHRVAFMFSRNIELAKMPEVVRHKCDNPPCCNPKHLEAGTHGDNVADRVERQRSASGEKNGRSKLTLSMVQEIRTSTETGYALAKRFGVDAKVIRNVRQGKTWRSAI